MNRIRAFREQAGLTQEQVAEQIGTSIQQISRLEKGTRRLTVDWMRKLAPAFGCKPQDLMLSTLMDVPSVGDRLSDPHEAIVIGFWRKMGAEQRLLVLRMLAPPGVEIPAIDVSSERSKRN